MCKLESCTHKVKRSNSDLSSNEVKNEALPVTIENPKKSSKIEQQYLGLDLPNNFKNLSAKQKYSILSKKYGSNKKVLQKRFDQIYKHYRKQMYIPYESFSINNELLMDLRIFLKYFKEFDIAKKFKTNEAINYFKKIALNSLWLTQENFIQIHYKLVQLLQIKQEQLEKYIKVDFENGTEESDKMKQQLSYYIRLLLQNNSKIQGLLGLVSEQRVKTMLNDNSGKKTIKKIVQVHSGLMKDDVLLKLKERDQKRNNRKTVLGNYNTQIYNKISPQKTNLSPTKILDSNIQRSSPKKYSIYNQLQIQNIRCLQKKGQSIYSSLKLMSTQKEKQKLKQLINYQKKEKYLEGYFRRQKQLSDIVRSNSMNTKKDQMNTEDSTNNFSITSRKPIESLEKSISLKRNISLPKLKYA